MNTKGCCNKPVIALAFLACLLTNSVAAQPMVEAAAAGKASFQRCVACHLPDGVGIPGTFPPLKNRLAAMAATDAGREYLVLTVVKGLMGTINVAGQTYRGVMPAQAYGLDHAEIAALLNRAVVATSTDIDLSQLKAFTLTEIKTVVESNTAIKPLEVLAKRKAALK